MLSKLDQRTREIIALCLFAVALLVLLSLVTYNSSDPTLFTTSSGNRAVSNTVGIFGANLAALLLVAIGISAYWLPIFLIAAALQLCMTRLTPRPLLPALATRRSGHSPRNSYFADTHCVSPERRPEKTRPDSPQCQRRAQ